MNDDIGTLIEPDPVKFTWGAPGWYVVGIVLLLLVCAVLIMFYRHYQKNKYRRAALSWLESRERTMLAQKPAEVIYDAAMLMKRIAISRYGRNQVAAVREQEWMIFLNKVSKSQLFSAGDAAWLSNILYTAAGSLKESETKSFIAKTKKWIKSHRYAL
jgi:cytochrome b subunit of formate dehydrogenase